MQALLPIVPVPALIGFIFLALAPVTLSRAAILVIGIAAGLLPALLMAAVVTSCVGSGCEGATIVPILTLDVIGLAAQIGMSLDPLSIVAGITVTVVGALVLIYSAAYMAAEPVLDLRRYFALMNLFLTGMLAVVLAADALLLFLGWETVGICSFLLIAYYTKVPKAVAAGRKALLTTRVADVMLLAGLMLLFLATGSTRFDVMLAALPSIEPWRLLAIAGLIALGALGKSAQIPFHTWLPSAMAGPTPVSALLHSATMVAAGVILLVRLSPLLAAAPEIAAATATLGIATAAFGALAALVQRDVKKLLAFSTMSQIGFMVLALGLGAPAAALAHFAIHAAFKSLLFLSAGVMSHAAGGSTAITALRGSRKRQPLAFWTFAIGAGSLAGLPLLTAGWYSKEAVLAAVWSSGPWGAVVWLLAVLAVILTGAYASRVALVAADNESGLLEPSWGGIAVQLPLTLLAIVALGGGVTVGALIGFAGGTPSELPLIATLAGAAAPLLGAGLGWRLVTHPRNLRRLALIVRHLTAFRVDTLYYLVLVRNFRRLTQSLSGAAAADIRPVAKASRTADHERESTVVRLVAGDPIGRVALAVARIFVEHFVARFDPDRIDQAWMRLARGLGDGWAQARRLQTGRVRDHSLGIALGFVGLLLFAWGTSWR
jgi:NADH-quinone oxidoreductase subunit L